jgi:hypothetical protein
MRQRVCPRRQRDRFLARGGRRVRHRAPRGVTEDQRQHHDGHDGYARHPRTAASRRDIDIASTRHRTCAIT